MFLLSSACCRRATWVAILVEVVCLCSIVCYAARAAGDLDLQAPGVQRGSVPGHRVAADPRRGRQCAGPLQADTSRGAGPTALLLSLRSAIGSCVWHEPSHKLAALPLCAAPTLRGTVLQPSCQPTPRWLGVLQDAVRGEFREVAKLLSDNGGRIHEDGGLVRMCRTSYGQVWCPPARCCAAAALLCSRLCSTLHCWVVSSCGHAARNDGSLLRCRWSCVTASWRAFLAMFRSRCLTLTQSGERSGCRLCLRLCRSAGLQLPHASK